MSSTRKLPSFPLHHFFLQLSKKNKVVFAVLYAMIIFLVVSMLVVYADPTGWCIELTEITSEEGIDAMLYQEIASYHDIEVWLPGVVQSTTYAAGPIQPKMWVVGLFLIFQIIGWSVMIASSTRITNYWCYLFYLLYGMFLFFSGVGGVIWPEQPYILGGVIIILQLVLAYLFQQGILKINLIGRTFSFLGLNAVIFGIAAWLRGWNGVHAISVGTFPVLAVVVLLYLFFIGKDFTNLFLFVSTNHKNPKRRLGLALFLPLVILFTGFCFLIMNQYIRWFDLEFIPRINFSPFYLLAFISLFTISTSQNIYPRLRSMLRTTSGYANLLAAFVIISLSGITFHLAVGELLFMNLVERHTIIFITVTGLLYAIYILLNYFTEIRQRLNIYYVSLMGGKVAYFFVVFATIFASFSIEASSLSKSLKLYLAIQNNRDADQAVLEGRSKDALGDYRASLLLANGSAKAHYNAASLIMGGSRNIDSVLTHYEYADIAFQFPYASLNHGNFLMGFRKYDMAESVYQNYLFKHDDPFIRNNLAYIYLRGGKPDDAIDQLKLALKEEPRNSGMLSNLGLVYLKYRRSEQAGQFFEAAMDSPEPSANAVCNAFFHQYIFEKEEPTVAPELFKIPAISQSRGIRHNLALLQFREGNLDSAQAITEGLNAEMESPAPMLLDGLIKFRKGEIMSAITRVQYLDEKYEEFRKVSDHALGAEYLRAGIPEMASAYFLKAGQAGMIEDQVLAYALEADAGRHEKAMRHFNALRIENPELWSATSKQLSILLTAYGQYLAASTDFPPEQFDQNDQMRVALIAGKAGFLIESLEAFRRIKTYDPENPNIYLEMGRIYLENGDSTAVSDLEYGLEFDKDNVDLQVELARGYILTGEKAKARQLSNSLTSKAPDHSGVQHLQAVLALSEGDTTQALDLLHKINQNHPLHTKALLTLGEIYRKQDNAFKGYQVFFDATELNDQNSDLWYYLGIFAQMLGEPSYPDAAAAALNAIRLAPNEFREKEIAADLAEPLRQLYEDQKAFDMIETK